MENRVCENQETTIIRAFEFRKEGLEYLQKLPLEEKITLSKNLIVSCMETFGEQVYISFSGGKDSTVLSSLVCSLKPDILHLFSDTGCEYPETLSFVEEERQRGKNIVPVRPVCRDGSVIVIAQRFQQNNFIGARQLDFSHNPTCFFQTQE